MQSFWHTTASKGNCNWCQTFYWKITFLLSGVLWHSSSCPANPSRVGIADASNYNDDGDNESVSMFVGAMELLKEDYLKKNHPDVVAFMKVRYAMNLTQCIVNGICADKKSK